MREILLEMYEKLWEADKDKFAWNMILKDTLEKLETFNIKERCIAKDLLMKKKQSSILKKNSDGKNTI